MFFGPQGSGKGTQAKLLGQELGVPHISTGDLLRDEMSSGTDIGESIRRIVDAGRLVPDEIILYMAEKRLSQPDCGGGFIADGFPRSLGQLLELPMVWQVDHAIHLWIDTQTSIDRLARRENCSQCTATYGPKTPPRTKGICDKCGATLVQRADDAAQAAVVQRLELYWSEIASVLEYFRSGGLLTTIDGRQDIPVIQASIMQLIRGQG